MQVINRINFLARRKRAAQETGKQSGLNLPDFQDQEAVQRFFLQEVQLGEELLGQGDIENGIEHLSMAVAVCGQPHSLLGVLVIYTLRRRLIKYLTLIDIFFIFFQQQTLPAQIYTLLLQNLEKAQTKVKAHASQSIKGAAQKKSELNEEDVE